MIIVKNNCLNLNEENEHDMELTVNIKEQSKIATFLNLLKKMDYIDIISVKDEESLPAEHRALLDERLKKIEKGESTFTPWETIKQKYEDKAV